VGALIIPGQPASSHLFQWRLLLDRLGGLVFSDRLNNPYACIKELETGEKIKAGEVKSIVIYSVFSWRLVDMCLGRQYFMHRG